jgi:hypothetical protein
MKSGCDTRLDAASGERGHGVAKPQGTKSNRYAVNLVYGSSIFPPELHSRSGKLPLSIPRCRVSGVRMGGGCRDKDAISGWIGVPKLIPFE